MIVRRGGAAITSAEGAGPPVPCPSFQTITVKCYCARSRSTIGHINVLGIGTTRLLAVAVKALCLALI